VTDRRDHGRGPNLRSRRRFIAGVGALGGAALVSTSEFASAEPPPEIPTIRLFGGPVTCLAPQYLAQELLYSEGFTDVRYPKFPTEIRSWPPDDVISGQVDLSFTFIPTVIARVDTGAPIVMLAGSHIGCVELIARNEVKSTRDLKGRVVGFDTDTQLFVSMFAAYVGLDPQKDIRWLRAPFAEHVKLLTEGRIDAFMAGPPRALNLRDGSLAHALVNTTTDKPWSNYFCCMITGSKEFVSRYPVATKRALRALLKSVDICGAQPRRVARMMADRGLGSYETTLQVLREIPFGKWREFNPDDSLRFFTVRMRELQFIKSTPQQIIANGTDWRFLNELKRELKG
jgi:NitT/TauT family transport system substrate-binding protein